MTRPVFRSLDQHSGEHRPPAVFFAAMSSADERVEELVGLRERVEAVRALHAQAGWASGWRHCGECGFNVEWPCPTIRALDGSV